MPMAGDTLRLGLLVQTLADILEATQPNQFVPDDLWILILGGYRTDPRAVTAACG